MIIVWPIQVGQQEDVCAVLSSDKNITTFVSHATGGGGGVSKEICGTVRLPVRRHVSRQWLSKWREKCLSKRRIKNSISSRKYCSDFLDLEILKVSMVLENET